MQCYVRIVFRLDSNHSLCPSIPKFTDPICSVHQNPSRQKVASIWAYMCSRLYWPYMFSGIHHEMTLYVQYTKNQAVKKWLPLELICAVYLEYIATIHFVCPYPSVLTLYFQYTNTLAVKKWLPFELICAVYIVTLNSSLCSNLVQIWIWRKIKCTLLSLALLSWAGCIIIWSSRAQFIAPYYSHMEFAAHSCQN